MKEEGKKEKKTLADKAKVKLAGLCARSEQCEYDLWKKMATMGLSREEAVGVMRELREGRFVDDLRYARAFVSDKARFVGWGPLKIRQALAAKRVKEAYIREALDSVDAVEMDATLRKLAESKSRNLDLSLLEERRKLMRLLVSRGFDYGKVKRVVELLTQEK